MEWKPVVRAEYILRASDTCLQIPLFSSFKTWGRGYGRQKSSGYQSNFTLLTVAWQCCFLTAWKCCWDWGLRASFPTQCRPTSGHSWACPQLAGWGDSGEPEVRSKHSHKQMKVCVWVGCNWEHHPVSWSGTQLPFPDYQVLFLHASWLVWAGQLSSCFGNGKVLKLCLFGSRTVNDCKIF